ncbi:MAG: nicotinate phosphoribosyltransferase, partial [Deinococcota bacterium]
VVLEGGRRTGPPETLGQAQARAHTDLARLPAGTRRPLNPHIYRVSLGDDVARLRDRVAEELRAHLEA